MPTIRNTRNNTRNRPARNFATANDAPAMVVKPRTAAMMPITRNTRAMWSTIHLRNRCCEYCAVAGLDRIGRAHYNRAVNAFLQAAIEEAEHGLAEGGIPIGSVIVHQGTIIGRGRNRRIQQGSAVLHAEMDALERTGRRRAATYRECVLYTTLSPCAMCSGAILLYGIPHVIVGEHETFTGEETLLQSRGVRVEVVNDAHCVEMMRRFIAERPELWNEDIGL